MLACGIMIRSMTGFRYPNWIRVSMGPHRAMELFIETLENILCNKEPVH
jgi:histidinol-phosphate aminotransferase